MCLDATSRRRTFGPDTAMKPMPRYNEILPTQMSLNITQSPIRL
jgi:hypothetical protein